MEAGIVEQQDKMEYVVQMRILRPKEGSYYRKKGYLSLVLAVRRKNTLKIYLILLPFTSVWHHFCKRPNRILRAIGGTPFKQT